MKGELLTDFEREWLALIRNLADGEISLKIYWLANN